MNGSAQLRAIRSSGQLLDLQSERRRALAAWVCLLAVALLFAPYAGAAWVSQETSCCTSDHCNIPQHHHRKAPVNKTPVHADCDHENGGALTECSMSCCQDDERPLMGAMNFVMPPVVFSAGAMPSAPALDAPSSIEIPRSVLPLLQPPRV
jgi:hypothetical protein